ncbi:isoleucine--tRNA ligase [Oscillospiraceae bacterium HV4-5-C5C]|nr:isoleucine--tRNA ligase [Oscillospiraceae bacterium HV4-5-C5C]
MYQKVPNDMHFAAREKTVTEFWKSQKIEEQARVSNPDGPVYTVYDGPPTANGKPHIGHILTRAIKDIIPRYRRMKGYQVLFKAGWDTHGLPVELEVEKALGINGKPQIEAYGIEPFIQKCKQSVWTYKDEWEQMSDRVGFWGDMDHPYVTYDNTYIESEWWALKQIWEKGLLYEGYKVVPYCPRCGTSLSSHEVAQGYKDVKDTSAFVRFAVTGEADTSFIAWTTTPWTLPSNVALCVNPDADYVLVETEENGRTVRYYLAKSLYAALLGEEQTRVLAEFKGHDLEGKAYEPLFTYALERIRQSHKKAYYVTMDDYVSLDEGTGIVHIAPAFGEDDARIGRHYDLPFVQLVQEDGKMPPEVSDFAGLFCKDADLPILKKLEADGKLFRTLKIEHSYPFCWRCDTPLIYYARHSWFIRMTALHDQLMQNNAGVNWIPESIRDGRFGNFLDNVVDWGLSRERYWGTPLPVWTCPDGHEHVIGSIEELKQLSDDCPADIELHKPYIDQVHLNCPECGKQMTRVPEVIDCWFDSGAMPFAQFHYPFENRELFKQHYPADFISEAQDQTRGWFYSLIAISTALFNRSPYKNVIVMGLVQDKNGLKMSKHKGNVVDPWSVMDKYGADAVRWYFYTNSQPWLPSRFSAEAVAETQRKFMATFWNTYAFYVMYANIDGFNPADYQLTYDALSVMDRWILSRLNTLIRQTDQALDRYDITGAARGLATFADELSNWYVRRGRERYWGHEMSQDKINAYMILYTCLKNLALLTAPFLPFISETIYRNLVINSESDAEPSVHLSRYPEACQAWIQPELESQMDEVLRIVTLGRAARNQSNLKNRQPLAQILVQSPRELPADFNELIKDELNIKNLSYIKNLDELQNYSFKPQLKTLGKRLGKLIPELSLALKQLDGQKAYRDLQQQHFIEVPLAETTVRLEAGDLLIEAEEVSGYSTQKDRDITIALNLQLTPGLIEEGLVRELVSKIQTMRKDSGFEVTDRIKLGYLAGAELQTVIQKFQADISRDVLAVSVEAIDSETDGKDWSINGLPCRLKVERVKQA